MKTFLVIVLILTIFGIVKGQKENSAKLPIVNGMATELPKPDYSQEAKKFCASGKVEVEVLIGEDGYVLEAKLISGNELLHISAISAAKKAKFRIIADAPIRTRGILVYNFITEKKCIVIDKFVNKRALHIPKPQIVGLKKSKHFQLKEEQIVTVQIVVDESGKVIYAKAISGQPMFRAACETSAREAKFAPTLIDPGPIKVKALLVYKFKPNGKVEF